MSPPETLEGLHRFPQKTEGSFCGGDISEKHWYSGCRYANIYNSVHFETNLSEVLICVVCNGRRPGDN